MSSPVPPDPPALDWAGQVGQTWLAQADRLELQLEPVADVLFDRAGLAPGESVLDVGCGRGATTRQAAALAAPGRCVGIDIAADLVAAADALDAAGSCEWWLADAQTHLFGTHRFDVLVSRFGVMFFGDPVAAFTNLRMAAVPGGRLVMVVWQTRDRSPFQQLLIDTIQRAATQVGLELPVSAPDAGPFAFGKPEFVTEVLGGAGWQEIEVEPLTVPLYVAGAGATVEEAVAVIGIGSLGAWIDRQDPAKASHILDAVKAELAARHDGTGFRIDGGIAVVTARTV